MDKLENLFKNNIEWADQIKAEDPTFFERLAVQQTPEYLWIGCADSRVPANELVGLLPGELFVHRNIANCVIQTDLNCQSVIFFAVQVLKVKHILVTGHYGCGGVQAAMGNTSAGIVDHWISNIRDIYSQKRKEVDSITDPQDRLNRLCELNVVQQVTNVSHSSAVQQAWQQGQELDVHGLIYDIGDGVLHKVTDPINSMEQIAEEYRVSRM